MSACQAFPAAPDRPPRWIEAAGWAGMLMVLGAFAAASYELGDDKRLLGALNALGASGVALLCWRQRAWPAMFLEIAWAAIALTSLAGWPSSRAFPAAAAITLAVGLLAVRASRSRG